MKTKRLVLELFGPLLIIGFLFSLCGRKFKNEFPDVEQRIAYDTWKENQLHRAVRDSISFGTEKTAEQIRAEVSALILADSVRLGWKLQSRQ